MMYDSISIPVDFFQTIVFTIGKIIFIETYTSISQSQESKTNSTTLFLVDERISLCFFFSFDRFVYQFNALSLHCIILLGPWSFLRDWDCWIDEDVYNSPISSSMSQVTYFMFFCLRCHRPQPEYLKSKWGADLHQISFLDFF